MSNPRYKFRAWDGERMIYDGDKVYPSHFGNELKAVSSPIEVYHNMVMFWVYETRLKEAGLQYFDHPSGFPCKAFMQYTGLRDKKGTEIFEGDLVSWDDGPDINEIGFDHGAFCWKTKDEDGDEEMCTIGGWNVRMTVIGNIYENPGMLGGE